MEAKKIKLIVLIGIVLGMVFSIGCTSSSVEENSGLIVEEKIKIGIIQFVEHPALDLATEGFISVLLDSEFSNNIDFIVKNGQGDMATTQLIANSFVSDGVDIIYAVATPAAQAAFNSTKDIPILISAVTDPVKAGLCESLEKPNTNVSGTSDEAPIEEQVRLMKEILPNSKKIGFIYNTSEKNSEIQLEILKDVAENLNSEVVALGITNITELEQGIDILLDKIDFLYTPADNLIASGIELIVNKTNQKGIPVLGAEEAHVNVGALFTFGVDYLSLGNQTGHIAIKVLNGEDVKNIPIEKAKNPTITINEKAFEILNIEIPQFSVK